MNEILILAMVDVLGMISLLLVGYSFGYNSGWIAGVNAFIKSLKKSEEEE